MIQNFNKRKIEDFSVQFVPFWAGNPYQGQLSKGLTRLGVKMEKGDNLKAVFKRVFWGHKKVDILHLHWLPSIVKPKLLSALRSVAFIIRLFVLRLCRTKIVWTVHNISSHESKYLRFDWLIRYLVISLGHALIVHSEAAKQQVLSKWRLKKSNNIFVVPHANYIGCYKNDIDEVSAKKQLGISESKFVVLLIGAIRPYKGVEELIKAFKKLGEESACLVIAGKPLNEEFCSLIEQQIAEYENIKFEPRFIADDDIQVFMAASDVVVFPYRKVFSSGATVLAMSFGKACIAPDLENITESLNASGAFLYDTGNEDGLTQAMKRALDNPAKIRQMGENNLQKAKQHDWNRMAEMTLAVYRFCLCGTKKLAAKKMETKSVTEEVTADEYRSGLYNL